MLVRPPLGAIMDTLLVTNLNQIGMDFRVAKSFFYVPTDMVDSIDFTGSNTLWFSYWAPGIGQAKLAFVISERYLRPLSFENVPRL